MERRKMLFWDLISQADGQRNSQYRVWRDVESVWELTEWKIGLQRDGRFEQGIGKETQEKIL